MKESLVATRKEKRDRLTEMGKFPYASFSFVKDDIQSVLDSFQEDCSYQIAGRIVSRRGHGKVMFAHIQDFTGTIQIYFKAQEEDAKKLVKCLDVGDFVRVCGKTFVTKTGEQTIEVTELECISKSIYPLPDKWNKLQDPNLRLRQRYLDLVMNTSVHSRFVQRSLMIRFIRHFLEDQGFLEVETPMMHSFSGGASATPFVTHHNTLDQDFYLRIAPELYLKRLLVGGFENIFELNRNFRNEGVSMKHNPEFTMLEVYSAYKNYQDMMALVEKMIRSCAEEFLKDTDGTIQWKDHTISLIKPFRVMTMYDSVQEEISCDLATASVEELCELLPLQENKPLSRDECIVALFESLVEPNLIQPTFIIDYPSYLCPLCKTKPDDTSISERFELFIGGMELANAYSELNNPEEQATRFRQQVGEGAPIDEDYVQALSYGMPPAGGLGVGIDRLMMLLLQVESIKEVILFPHMRSYQQEDIPDTPE